MRRAHALQGVIGDALESKRRTSSRKRPAPLPNYNPVPHRKIANTTNAASQSLHNGTDSANNTPSVFQADSQREGFGGFEQLFAGNGMGFPLEEEEEDARWRHTGQGSSKDPAESLFESISKAFCCMSGGGPREDRRPMQVRGVVGTRQGRSLDAQVRRLAKSLYTVECSSLLVAVCASCPGGKGVGIGAALRAGQLSCCRRTYLLVTAVLLYCNVYVFSPRKLKLYLVINAFPS